MKALECPFGESDYLSPMYRYVALASLLLLSACFMHKKTSKMPEAAAIAATEEEQPAVKKKKERPAKPKKPEAFRYGSTRAEIQPQTADRSELLIAEFNKPQGHMAVYQYSRFGKAAYKSGKYYLYFMNDTLIRKSGEEDLREGARDAVDEYYSNKDDE